MKPRDDLFQLIRSLTPNEKRYFKVYAAQYKKGEKAKGKNNYIRLFDALDKQKVYDERKLKKRFEGEKWIRHLSAEKHHLYRMVLRSMRSYQAEKSIVIQLNEMMQDADFLKQKGLYDQCERQLARARKRATAYDAPLIAVEIIGRQMQMLVLRKERGVKGKMEELLADWKALMTLIARSEEVFVTYQQVLLDSRMRGVEGQKAVDVRLDAAIDDLPPEALSGSAVLYRFYLRAIGAQQTGGWAQAFQWRQEALDFWEAEPRLQQRYAHRYKTAMANFLATAAMAGQWAAMPPIIEKLRALPAADFDDSTEIFQNVYFYDLLLKLNSGDLDGAAALVPAIETGLQRHSAHINPTRLLSFFYNITVLYYFREEWKAALQWLMRILHHQRSDHRQDLQEFGRLLELVLHFELGNLDVLEYRIPATRRWLRDRGRDVRTDDVLIGLLQKGIAQGGSVAAEAWAEADVALTRIIGELEGKTLAGTLECRFWVRSKHVGRHLGDLLVENPFE